MKSITKAVIVAAGESNRLKPLTNTKPKGLLEVAGETMLERSVRLLYENNIEDILIVVGSMREQIQDTIGNRCKYAFNPFYRETNNMASLWFAKDWVDNQPFVYLHNDLVYDPELLSLFLSSDYPDAALLVDIGPTDEEAMKVRLIDDKFYESNKEIPISEAAGEWVGIAGFHHPNVLFDNINKLLEQRHFKAYDTLAFTQLAQEGVHFSIVPTDGLDWVEVDFKSDLDKARKIFG